MTKFMKKHWSGLVIAVIAVLILRHEYSLLDRFQWRIPNGMQNPFFVATAHWSIRFLLVSLLMSPIYALTGWRFPLKLRKPLGLVAFGFASIHVYIYLAKRFAAIEEYSLIDSLTRPVYILYGLIAFVILALMAVTSVKPMMKLMGRFWKPLHRLVYIAGILIIVHSIMAISMSKRSVMMAEESTQMAQIYLIILVILLVLRIPMIKHGLQAIIPFAPKRRKSKPKHSLVAS